MPEELMKIGQEDSMLPLLLMAGAGGAAGHRIARQMAFKKFPRVAAKFTGHGKDIVESGKKFLKTELAGKPGAARHWDAAKDALKKQLKYRKALREYTTPGLLAGAGVGGVLGRGVQKELSGLSGIDVVPTSYV